MKKRRFTQSRQQVIVTSEPNSDKISYAEMTRTLKDGIGMDALGVKLTELRLTKSGAISMALGKGAEGSLTAEKLKVEVVLGSDAGVRLHLCLEIQGNGMDDDHRDIQEGISREGVPLSQLKIN